MWRGTGQRQGKRWENVVKHVHHPLTASRGKSSRSHGAVSTDDRFPRCDPEPLSVTTSPWASGPLRRRYTIRRSDPAEGIADFEIEIHDGRGPATRWAVKAELGEHIEAIGPRGGISLRPTATSHLFVVDDSAMPAAFVVLEALAAGTPATALLVTGHGAKSRPAPAGAPATSLIWLDRAEMLEMLSDLHPATGTAAYVFGERHLVSTAEGLLVAGGLDRDAVASRAYWRLDQPNASQGEPSFN